ncbi:MAG: aldo/keto reductase [Planctomycetota bacterium]|nr:aldo/keto reductase [Planctomycetota bacterium]
MQYTTLGNTGLLVSRICLGTMTFGGTGSWQSIGTLDQTAADTLVEQSIAAGVNFIDTADVYSEGLAETMLGQSLINLNVPRQSVVVATKAFGRVGPGRNDIGSSRGHLLDAIDASLRRLKTDYIDLYQIHGWDTITPIEETLRALEDIVRSGKVRYIGCSNWHAWRLMQAIGVAAQRQYSPLVTLQAYYSLVARDMDRELVPLLQDQKVGLLVWSPLAGGMLSGKFTRENQTPENARRSNWDFPPTNRERLWNVLDVLRPIAEGHNVSCARVALAWLLAKPFVTSVIIGAKRPDQLQDNLAASDLVLSAEEVSKLDEVSKLPDEYPTWMVQRQGMTRWGVQ